MADNTKIVWHDQQVLNMVVGVAARKLNKCAVSLHARIIKNISKPTRTHGPSRLGEFPHADTGRLRQSIFIRTATPDDLTAVVGTNLRYGRFLELGTVKMDARSYLRRTLNDMSRGELWRIFNNG